MRRIPAEQSIGQRFGTLVVSRTLGLCQAGQKRMMRVECVCDCGVKVKPFLNDLRAGRTKSCGRHPRYAERHMPALNQIYNHSYKARAARNGVAFTLSLESFFELSQQPCHYCGRPPSGASYRGRRGVVKTGKGESVFLYNGLDRKNPTKGYTRRNVVPCCGVCNHAKHTMSYSEFTRWLDDLVRFRS